MDDKINIVEEIKELNSIGNTLKELSIRTKPIHKDDLKCVLGTQIERLKLIINKL